MYNKKCGRFLEVSGGFQDNPSLTNHTVYKTLHANKMEMNEQWMAKHKWQKLHFSRYMQKKGSLTQNKLFSSITKLDGFSAQYYQITLPLRDNYNTLYISLSTIRPFVQSNCHILGFGPSNLHNIFLSLKGGCEQIVTCKLQTNTNLKGTCFENWQHAFKAKSANFSGTLKTFLSNINQRHC